MRNKNPSNTSVTIIFDMHWIEFVESVFLNIISIWVTIHFYTLGFLLTEHINETIPRFLVHGVYVRRSYECTADKEYK